MKWLFTLLMIFVVSVVQAGTNNPVVQALSVQTDTNGVLFGPSTNFYTLNPPPGSAGNAVTTNQLNSATNTLWNDIMALTNTFGGNVDLSFTNDFVRLGQAVTNLVLTNAPITYFAISDGTAYYGTNDTAYASAADGALARGAMQTNYDGIVTLANTNSTSLGGLFLRNPIVASASSQRIGFGVAVSNAWLGANDTLVLNTPYFYRYYGSDDASGFLIYDAGNFVSGVDYQPAGNYLTNLTASAIAAVGGLTNQWNDPYMLSSNILGNVVSGTCTITRAMGNALWIIPTNTVYFTADSTMTDSNAAVGFTLDIFYNASTFGFVGATMTNTATLVSNQWNSLIFWKGYGATNFVGR